jgi:thiol-disulfide isomerase/thioredoxin
MFNVFKNITLDKKMIIYFVMPLLMAFACKKEGITGSEAAMGPKLATASGASKFEPEVIMGGPTNISVDLMNPSINGKARIIGFYSDQNFLADTALIKNGMIEYKNAKGLPQGLYYLGINDRQDYIQLILSKDQEFKVKVDLNDINSTIIFEGSDDNKLFIENSRYEATINPKIIELANKLKGLTSASPNYAQLKAEKDKLEDEKMNVLKGLVKQYPDLLFPAYKLAGQNPKVKDQLPDEQKVAEFRKEFWDGVNFADSRLLRTPVIGNKLKRYIKELTPQNANSLVESSKMLIDKTVNHPEYMKVFANYVVLEYEPGKSTVMDAENIFVSMVQNYFTKERAFWSDSLEVNAIQQRASEMAGSLLGKKGPNVISTDQFGKQQQIYNSKADYVVVYMYNPECEHCMEETPKLLQYYNQNKGLVDVFAIAIDTDDAKWKAYIAKNNMTWTNVHDPSNRSIYGKYFVDITPELYLLNKERIIIGKNLKTNQIQTVLDRDRAKK